MLITEDKNTNKSKKNSYKAIAGTILDIKNLAKLGLPCFKKRVIK